MTEGSGRQLVVGQAIGDGAGLKGYSRASHRELPFARDVGLARVAGGAAAAADAPRVPALAAGWTAMRNQLRPIMIGSQL